MACCSERVVTAYSLPWVWLCIVWKACGGEEKQERQERGINNNNDDDEWFILRCNPKAEKKNENATYQTETSIFVARCYRLFLDVNVCVRLDIWDVREQY